MMADQAGTAATACQACGGPLPAPPDLEAIAAEADVTLGLEFRRAVVRIDWAAAPPSGLMHTLLAWLPSVKQRGAVWQGGQELWAERVSGLDQGACPTCSAAAGSLEASPPIQDEHDSQTIVGLPRPSVQSGARLIALEGPVHGHEFGLGGPVTTIGRSIGCQVTIDDERVAQQHVRIVRQEQRWLVEDVVSSGLAYVNDEQLTQARELSSGDTIRIGSARLRFEANGRGNEDALSPLR